MLTSGVRSRLSPHSGMCYRTRLQEVHHHAHALAQTAGENTSLSGMGEGWTRCQSGRDWRRGGEAGEEGHGRDGREGAGNRYAVIDSLHLQTAGVQQLKMVASYQRTH